MPMDVEYHGGGCCGITHIFGFGYPTEARLTALKNWLADFVDRQYELEFGEYDGEFSCALEATLTDGQMVEWAPVLKKHGFKIAHRFFNSNSGNVVNVLYYNPAGKEGEDRVGKAPYKW